MIIYLFLFLFLNQQTQLVNVITQNALPLVQDPFGNYVVQYVLELGDAKYSDNLIRRFIEPVRELSVQKFSSNVIEKVSFKVYEFLLY